MYPDLNLKENVIHGTKDRPIHALHFSTADESFFVPNHWHGYIEILLIRRGIYECSINLETQILHAGDICILKRGDLHQIKNLETDCCHDALLFEPEILLFAYSDTWNATILQPFLHHALLIKNVISTDHPAHAPLHSLIDLLLRTALEEGNRWYEQSKLRLLELMILLEQYQCLISAESARSDMEIKKIDRYKQIVSYMEHHYQEPVTLQELAAIIPCNSQYLCRFFKEVSGMTPIRYLIQYRIEESCKRLLETSDSVSDIALDCGFENISYFIRKFREIKSCTPKEYRMRNSISS